jgi:cellulose synthase/poly-beta-1,6-N-acetylglucosamine synthase-like glycosyltransferase
MNPSFTSDKTVTAVDHSDFPGGFAVLMAAYIRDDPHLFEVAVDSVFANTLQPTQFLLVADGQLSDELEQILASLQVRHGNRVELLRQPENVGLARALNAGLRHITLPWVVRADADDFNVPHRFASLATLLASQPDLDLLGSAILEVDKAGNAVAVRVVPTTDAEIRQFAKFRNPFNHMAVAYRRDAVLACGGYADVELKEDWALWCHLLARKTRVANSAEVLVRATAGWDMYRRRGGWRYAKSEWQLQNVMLACGLKTRYQAWRDGISRATGFLLPSLLRGKIYEFFLRKSN